MRGKTYVYFNGKTEYIGTGGEEQTAYPCPIYCTLKLQVLALYCDF